MSTQSTMPQRPADNAPLVEKMTWLILTHGYCELNDTVVELWEPGDGCQLKPIAFQRKFNAWVEVWTGPNGGLHDTKATAMWSLAPDRVSIRGIRMRPDKPFPTYVEDGAIYKNTYRKPVHEGQGDIKPFNAFMAHLLPTKSERELFLDWLAHKWKSPAIPGFSIVMVATDAAGQPVYGTGRGFLRDILAKLLGSKYVMPIDFSILSGTSAQSVYTDWAAYSLLVTVTEAKDTADAGRWSGRRAVYEHLKEIVDPRPIERTFQPKGKPWFRDLCFASTLVFSNHNDALQIPPDDRRFGVLRNGVKMPTKMAEKLTAWLEVPGNIAALARMLEARNIKGFNAYDPPATAGKVLMQELARSELDEAFAVVRRLLGRDALFTSEQIERAVANEIGDRARGEEFERRVGAWVRRSSKRVGELRMPRKAAFGGRLNARPRILCWRDYAGKPVTDAGKAQELVAASEKAIENAHNEQPTAAEQAAAAAGQPTAEPNVVPLSGIDVDELRRQLRSRPRPRR